MPRKRGVARYLRDTYQGWTSPGAPPIPSLGGSAATKVKEEGEEPGRKNVPGEKKLGCLKW